MDYEKFKKEVECRIRSYLPVEWNDWKIEIYPKLKVNENLDAISVIPPEAEQQGTAAYPVFYLQDLYKLYQDGNNLGEILRHVAGMMKNVPPPEEITKAGFDPGAFKDCIVFQLINRKKNQQLLEELPHRDFLDLAVIYRILLFDRSGRWSGMLVTEDLMEVWGMTEEDLYQIAYKHTPEALPFMIEGAGRLFESEIIIKDPDRILILTNDSFQFGAAAMLYPDVMEMAAKQFKDDFLILPGSIHELYLVKKVPGDTSGWRHAVKIANEELVDVSEWLSDSLYLYDYKEKTINIL